MVTRKPLPPGSQIPSSPPYPSSPVHNSAPRFDFNSSHDVRSETEEIWANEDLLAGSIPVSLQAGAGRKSMDSSRSREDIPESLRVGPGAHTSRGSDEITRPSTANTNPFLRKQQTGQDGLNDGRESSAGAWGTPSQRPPIPTNQPPPPPVQPGELTNINENTMGSKYK